MMIGCMVYAMELWRRPEQPQPSTTDIARAMGINFTRAQGCRNKIWLPERQLAERVVKELMEEEEKAKATASRHVVSA